MKGEDMATGKFTEEMKAEFHAVDGAFTSFTDEEVRKKTFNVKAVIRKLLEKYIGKENIPRVNVTEKQTIEFKVCEKSKGNFSDRIEIPCKYSKKSSDEMSIYFNTTHIDGFQIAPWDYWYVYFKEEENVPYIGVLSRDVWEGMYDIDDIDESEIQGNKHLEVTYQVPVDQLSIIEEEAPSFQNKPIGNIDSVTNSISPEESALRQKNRKIMGNRGEEIAVEIEKRRLSKLGREDLIGRIIPVGKKKDGLGYDVRSVDVDDNNMTHDIFIEVKATSGDIDRPFDISRRELKVSQRFREYYYLYRIYNLRENSSDVRFYKVKGALDDNYDLEATGYRAYKKTDQDEV